MCACVYVCFLLYLSSGLCSWATPCSFGKPTWIDRVNRNKFLNQEADRAWNKEQTTHVATSHMSLLGLSHCKSLTM